MPELSSSPELSRFPENVRSAVEMLREVARLPERHPDARILRRVALRKLVDEFRIESQVGAKLHRERAEIAAGRLADGNPRDLLRELGEAIGWLMFAPAADGKSSFGKRRAKAKAASWKSGSSSKPAAEGDPLDMFVPKFASPRPKSEVRSLKAGSPPKRRG